GVGDGDGDRYDVNGVGVGFLKQEEKNTQTHSGSQLPDPPPDSDLTIAEIAKAHPRLERPIETEQAIIFALDGGTGPGDRAIAGLTARFGDARKAMQFLLDKTRLYKQITDMWPPGQFVTASVAWFKCGCYDE